MQPPSPSSGGKHLSPETWSWLTILVAVLQTWPILLTASVALSLPTAHIWPGPP